MQLGNLTHIYFCVYVSYAVTSFPGGKFTLSALDRFEAASGISVYEQLAPEILPKMASTLHLDVSTLNNPKQLFEGWVSGKGSQPPTWETLLMVLIHHPLRNEIEDFFNRVTPVTQAVSSVHTLLTGHVNGLFFTLHYLILQLLELKKSKQIQRSSSTEGNVYKSFSVQINVVADIHIRSEGYKQKLWREWTNLCRQEALHPI